jgi:hypothetical protein
MQNGKILVLRKSQLESYGLRECFDIDPFASLDKTVFSLYTAFYFENEFTLNGQNHILAQINIVAEQSYIEFYTLCTHSKIQTMELLSVLINEIFINVNRFWIGIRFDTANFAQEIRSYAELGFKSPLPMTVTPSGLVEKDMFLGLSLIRQEQLRLRAIDNLIKSEEKGNTEKERMKEKRLINKRLDNIVLEALKIRDIFSMQNNCLHYYRLSASILKYVHDLTRDKLVEVGGPLIVYNITRYGIGNVINFAIPLDKVAYGRGEPHYSVDLPIDAITYSFFHTHPHIINMNENAVLTWPSANDIRLTIDRFVYTKTLINFVFAMEGVYALSLTDKFMRYIESEDVKRLPCTTFLGRTVETKLLDIELYRHSKSDRANTTLETESIFESFIFLINNYTLKEFYQDIFKLYKPEKQNSKDRKIVDQCFIRPDDEDFMLFNMQFRSWDELEDVGQLLSYISVPSAISNCTINIERSVATEYIY